VRVSCEDSFKNIYGKYICTKCLRIFVPIHNGWNVREMFYRGEGYNALELFKDCTMDE